MFRKMLITVATAAAACVLAPFALASPSATLEGEQFGNGVVETRCHWDSIGWSSAISFQASGTATGPYAGTFVKTGTAKLSYMGLSGGPPALTQFDGTFTITSAAATIKGTLHRVSGRSFGTGTCNAAASNSTINASGLVYTVTLADGTIDQGTVDLSMSDESPAYSAAFRSTHRVADMDLDGVHDGLDNCLTTANPDQLDRDRDGIGDMCDPIDGRPALFADLVAAS